MARIVQLSTHTMTLPRHGGQVRSNRIGAILEEAGHDMTRIAIGFRPPDYLDTDTETHINIAPSSYISHQVYRRDFGEAWVYISDYGTLKALEYCKATRDILFDKLTATAPDAIILEHPWLWPLVKAFFAQGYPACPVIYNSQNVEIDLKTSIFAKLDVPVPETILPEIDALERDLVVSAFGTTTCTQGDADIYTGWGGQNVVVAPNATDRRDLGHLIDILPEGLEPRHSYAFIVGSAHPPNISGFMELVAPILPELGVNERIAIAGSAASHIVIEFERAGGGLYTDGRLVNLGFVNDITLQAALANASVVCVPIEYGGGSNLKTAEALASGRRALATSVAMRGYSEYAGAEQLVVADGAAFGEALLQALRAPFQTFPVTDVDGLFWDSSLRPLVRMIQQAL